MRTLFLVLALAHVAGCTCGKKKAANKAIPTPPPVIETKPPEAPPRAEFKPVTSGGLRRFAAPRGQEVTSVSSSPDGALLAAVTGRALYLFDASLAGSRIVELPGVATHPRQVVALSDARVAVFAPVPTGERATRVWFVDAKESKILVERRVDGAVELGAALSLGRFAAFSVDPPSVTVFDADGKELAKKTIPGGPVRFEAAPDASWGALACKGSDGGYPGVVIVDVRGAAPSIEPLSLGPGVLVPVVALPIRDAVLVAGHAESDRPAAIVVPLAGGDPIARPAVGPGRVVGAARAEDGSRAAIFTHEKTGEETARRTGAIYDATTWTAIGRAEGGPTLPTTRSVSRGARAHVVDCHAALVVDLAAMTVVDEATIPSPQKGPCLDGPWRIGDRLAARDHAIVVTWPSR